MSGIAGVINFDGAAVEPGLIQGMTSSMDYRGPDGINHWNEGGAALGHCMLHTTPESLQERQPVTNEDGSLVLVMDGRVDNWVELRRELLSRGAWLRNRSDAELVLRAYQLWGHDCLSRIEGDFALAIWNAQDRRLFCARDPMGNKPFNYYWNGRSVVFASEVHAILALPDIPQVVNKGVLAEWLASEWYSRDETFWQGIRRLVAAHYMVVDFSGPKIDQYWSPDLFATLSYSRDEEYIEHYRELFTETVRRLSRSHKPVSYEVSGGLDSSAIFAVADHLHQRQQLLAPDLTGFTMNFQGDPDADEIEYCRAIGAMLGKPIVEIPPAKPSLSWYRESASKFKYFPGFPNGVMAHNLMQRVDDSGSRVLLNGVGGDEWLGASRIYYCEEIAAKHWPHVRSLFREDVGSSGLLRSVWWLLRYGIAPSLPLFVRKSLQGIRDKHVLGFNRRNWLKPDLRRALAEQRTRHRSLPKRKIRWPGQRGELAVLADAYSVIAHESHEKSAATFGLELRRPFYTSDMVQFSFMVPKRLLFAGGVNRFAHRQAMRGLLPRQILERQTKAEFSVTYHHYLSEMSDLLTGDIPARRALWIDQKQTGILYANYKEGNKHSGWSAFMLWVLFGCDTFTPLD